MGAGVANALQVAHFLAIIECFTFRWQLWIFHIRQSLLYSHPNARTRSKCREKRLARRPQGCFIRGRVRLWWNWQTRYFEVVVGKPVQVQVLLCAPFFDSGANSPYPWLEEAVLFCRGNRMNPKPERHNGLTICFAAIGVLLFVSASVLLVL